MNLYLRVLLVKDNNGFNITKMILYLRDNTDDTVLHRLYCI